VPPSTLTESMLALAGVGAAVALVLGATTTSPAFAVIRNHDGTLTISIERASGVAGANAKLDQLGIRAQVMQHAPAGWRCTSAGAQQGQGARHHRRSCAPHRAPAWNRRVRSPTPTGRSIRASFRPAGPWRSPRPLHPRGGTAATVARVAGCGGAAEQGPPATAVRLLRSRGPTAATPAPPVTAHPWLADTTCVVVSDLGEDREAPLFGEPVHSVLDCGLHL
jgi:hypothetical protein